MLQRTESLAELSVSFETYDLPEAEQSCWVPLFANPTIAQGFPVRRRDNEEQGIEIPLEMMAALGGARHMTNYEGGLVLKGFSTMFVPVKRYRKSVQWHMIFDRQGNRLSYRELQGLSSNRVLLDQLTQECVRGARAFLGWWKAAEIHLGTREAAYGSIDWSPAKKVGRPIKFSGAEIGFQWMFTGKLSFKLGAKDGNFHFSHERPFRQLIKCAKDTPITLYDLQDRRAWLVPALDVMLHIVHTRHHLAPYQIGGRTVELPAAAPQGGRSAEDAILENQKLPIDEANGPCAKGYSFKDAIIDLWSQIERLMEKEDLLGGASGLTLRGTTRNKLHGWEFMSLVHEKNYRQKEALIEKSSGGWVDLIDDIDTLVLMGTGFGDIIRPVSEISRLCRRWSSLPEGKDYLAANIPIMEVLYAEAGSRTSRKHLSTNHLQWHRGSTLFEFCINPDLDHCECDRTQQIYHESQFKTLGQVRPPGKLEDMGCVIFGQAHHFLKPKKTVNKKMNSVYNLPNVALQSLECSTSTPSPDEPMKSSLAKQVRVPTFGVNKNPGIVRPKNPCSPAPTMNTISCFADSIAKRRREMP
ncbi:MAG: hypothetical protein OHK93_000780 [Ramalina farinacea]|uniref:Uncharacterized protein n=1 Tax=Ramalina farinacea TaxID=258253 RepID=A0AA43QN91_9LECA|nr:hypothetical protein [Ramalina farinacea]